MYVCYFLLRRDRIIKQWSLFQRSLLKDSKRWNTVVTVVLVGAKDLPVLRDNGSVHNVYCEIQ
jgi:hypothetical protein